MIQSSPRVHLCIGIKMLCSEKNLNWMESALSVQIVSLLIDQGIIASIQWSLDYSHGEVRLFFSLFFKKHW